MSSHSNHIEDVKEDVTSAHKSLTFALTSYDVDEYNKQYIVELHEALVKLNEVKNLLK